MWIRIRVKMSLLIFALHVQLILGGGVGHQPGTTVHGQQNRRKNQQGKNQQTLHVHS